jgi:SOS response regulatory protein OraA/RecX
LQIDGDEYEKTIGKLAEAKWKSLSRERNIFMKMAKARDYLLQKGFESDLATQAISKLRNLTSED